MKQGIDVSKWQPQNDWQKVKADGIDFAIIRVGFCYNNGALKLDSAFTQHIKGALAAGLDVGIYRYSYATTEMCIRDRLDPSNPSTVLAKTNVPITVGGWMVYEIAVIDKDGDIIIHANAPGWIKLAVVNGMSNPMEIVMRLSVVDADAIHLSISYDGVNLTFKDLDDHNKDQTAHMGHFQDMKLHVSADDRETVSYTHLLHR